MKNYTLVRMFLFFAGSFLFMDFFFSGFFFARTDKEKKVLDIIFTWLKNNTV